jgi:hypothetical protein
MVITKDQADSILASDLTKVEADVNRLVKVPLTQNQFDSLVSFHFNTGSLGKSTLIKVLNTKDYSGAAEHFMDYTKGRVNGQLVEMKGLVRRRSEEKAMFLRKDSVGSSTVAAGAVVATGAATVASTPQHYWPYIIAGTIVVAALAFVLFEIYEFKKVN